MGAIDPVSQKPLGDPLVAGRYTLFDEIASGGMGSVHLGLLTAAEGFERVVAIKRAHPEVARDAELAEMFLDEARVASKVQHTNVVPALDFVSSGKELWLVMEYVHGAALSSLMKKLPVGRGVPPEIACTIAIELLRGLHAVHETRSASGSSLDIVHRDVSPQNVLVGSDGVTRLIDFGVAKALGQRHQTQVGHVKGKLSYLAPERLRGVHPERRVDVFSAAIVLWEMLTGCPLFDGSTEAELLAQVANPVIPSPRDINENVSEQLAAIVGRGLEVEPFRRFPSALDMASALAALGSAASSSEVGSWVTILAHDTLTARSGILSRIVNSRESAFRPETELTWSEDSTVALAKPSVGRTESSKPGERTPRATLPSASLQAKPTFKRKLAWLAILASGPVLLSLFLTGARPQSSKGPARPVSAVTATSLSVSTPAHPPAALVASGSVASGAGGRTAVQESKPPQSPLPSPSSYGAATNAPRALARSGLTARTLPNKSMPVVEGLAPMPELPEYRY